MKKYLQSASLTTGLAIFAMLFGAGNLIFPLKMGVVTGTKVGLGILAFILSGVLIPLAGLISIVFFDGDYRAFFYRIGKIPGAALIFFCMLTIGPLLIMPRIIDLTYELMRPFLGHLVPILPFSIGFALITFACAYKRNAIVDLLGKILSPLKLLTLFTIIGIGIWTRQPSQDTGISFGKTFLHSFQEGYNTLDLLATIFFGYIIISILKKTLHVHTPSDTRALAKIMLKGGLIGGFLLAVVYTGIACLGAFHGQQLNPALDAGRMFILTMMKILGTHGAFFVGMTVFVACLSTLIALASVVSEYLKNDISQHKLSYVTSLIIVLAIATAVAQFELGPLLHYSLPLILIVYPVLIVLTFCNIAYKLWGFKPVKIPVLLAFLVSTYWYGPEFLKLLREGTPTVETTKELSESPGL
jgi:branched-chain amino acid:cation transporter, LIVCS family